MVQGRDLDPAAIEVTLTDGLLSDAVLQRQVVGIGAGARYTLYDPGSDRLDFLIAGSSKPQQRPRGFG